MAVARAAVTTKAPATAPPAAAPAVVRRPGSAGPRVARAPLGPTVDPRFRGLLQRLAAQQGTVEATAGLPMSSPGDAAEREAEQVAERVMATPAARPAARTGAAVQRAAAGAVAGRAPADVSAELRDELGGGAALPASARAFLEPRFGTDFGGVRVHTGERAARVAVKLGARALTYLNHVFFAPGAYDPGGADGLRLLAHELTHVVQQGAAPPARGVSQRAAPQVQRGLVSEALDYFADKANNIPGFRMFTIVLGVNPINMGRVERSAANVMRAVVEFLPGGGLIREALDNHGVFDRVGAWVSEQINGLGITGGLIRDAINRFIGTLGPADVFRLGSVWERAKRIFSEPIDRILAFARGLVTGVVRFIKEAILRPLARLAEGTRGYDLLKAVLGEDPVTGEAVPRNAETLIGGFMKLIGQEEVWQNIQRGNAVARAWAWFQTALEGLLGFVREIPRTFLAAFQALEVVDIVLVPRAFAKVAAVFGSFVGRFFSWAAGTVLDLLEILFSVVAPGVMVYVRRAASAFQTILRNPLAFVRNLMRAGLMGLRQFMRNFLTHLRGSLIGWLTGAMSGANLYIPKGFHLREILKFGLSVLGLTWQNIRTKLVRATNETAVRAMEGAFDIVVVLVREGPAAAWQRILESLTNLREMVIEQVMRFVSERIVTAALTRLLSMLDPSGIGAVIQAVIAIYNTVMFFVERMRQIAQVAASFIDSISAIANGAVGAAANRVEQTMAGLLTLVISFLARLAGLGRVSDAVTRVIDRIRQPIDRALDRVVAWIVAQARRLGRVAVQTVGTVVNWWRERLQFTNKGGERHTLQFIGGGDSAQMGIATTLTTVRAYLDGRSDKDTDAWKMANSIFDDAMKVIYSPASKNHAEKVRLATIKTQLARVSAAFAKLAGDPPKAADYGSNSSPVYGNPVTVDVIVGKPLAGTITGAWPKDKHGYKEVSEAGLTTATDGWVQMHILSEKLGGSGTDFENLVPAPGSVNKGPFRSFEHATVALVKAKSGSIKNRVWVEVKVDGTKDAPDGLIGKAGLYLWKGREASPKWIKNEAPSLSASVRVPKPQILGPRRLVLNHTSGTEMTRDFNLSSAVAKLVKEGRYYDSWEDFVRSMKERGATTQQIQAVQSRAPVLNEP